MICLLALAMLATVAARFVGAILRFLESDGLHRSPEIGHESPLPDRRAVMGTAPLPAGGGGAGAERRYNPLPLRLGFALTLLMLLAWAACGGGANVTHMPGTPAGTYTITIIAAEQQANLTQTTTFKLTVNP